MHPGLEKRCLRELVVVARDGRELGGARAVFFALRGTSLGWLAAIGSVPPFVWAASAAYRLIAGNRGWISTRFFKAEACGLENRYPEVD
jgi:predicted DCC family thiol-disulfide oxidoreductase YuxK